MTVNKLIAQARAAKEAGTLKDQLAGNSGGDFEPVAAGTRGCRLVGYVEIGKRAQRPYQGKEKPPADEARLTFELYHKNDRRTIGGGDEAKEVFALHHERITLKGGERSSSYKLLKRMAYGRDIKNFAEMFGEAFTIKLHHNEVEKEGKKRTYVNMRSEDGEWTIGAPVVQVQDPEDPDGEPITKKRKLPLPVADLQLLLWDSPSIDQWNSIFIDGERTVKDADGNDTTKSKNWIQEDIITGALNFQGSPLHLLLETGGVELNLDGGKAAAAEEAEEDEVLETLEDEDELPEIEEEEQVEEEVKKAAPATAKKASTPAAKAAKKPAPSGDDDLDGLFDDLDDEIPY